MKKAQEQTEIKSGTGTVGVVAKNSIAFVEEVLSAFTAGKRVVLLREEDDQERIRLGGVQNIVNPALSHGWKKIQFSNIYSDDIAQVSFTSGTEGAPKGVMISHRNLADVVDRLKLVMEMDDSIREYIGVPVYHSFGFGRCRVVSDVGGEFYIPEHGFNPLEIQQLLSEGKINAFSAVPSLFRVLFQHLDLFGDEARQLKWIEIGSQYMSQAEKELLKHTFPNAKIVQHYGLTEASRTTFLKIHEESGSILESVGTTVGDTQFKITDTGRIAIKGSHVAKTLMVEGKLTPNVDEEGWLITSDQGRIDHSFLYYLGRADDLINCGGVKISPDALEREIRSQLDVKVGFCCAKVPDAMRGEAVLIAREPDCAASLDQLVAVAEQVLQTLKVNAKGSIKTIEIDILPVTPTGKVQRKKLTQYYQENASAQQSAQSKGASTKERQPRGEVAGTSSSPRLAGAALARAEEISTLWQDILGIDEVGYDESFMDLGGDSLTAISASLRMRKLGIPEQVCKGMLQGKTIAQLAREDCGNEAVPVDQSVTVKIFDNQNIRFLRGLLVLAVIFAHWSGGIFERLPGVFKKLEGGFAPLFAAGTPGFAIMYGVAIGYAFYPQFVQRPSRIRQLVINIALFLGGGISLLAVLRILAAWVGGTELTFTHFTNSFYSVLSFYFVATLSLYGWFWLLKKSRAPVLVALVLGFISHLIYLQWMYPLVDVRAEGLVELGKLIIAAKYSYFNMCSGVFWGMAFGIALTYARDAQAALGTTGLNSNEQSSSVDHSTANWVNSMALIGGLCIVASVMLSMVYGESEKWWMWPSTTVSGWKWLFYFGAILLLYRGVERYVLPKTEGCEWVKLVVDIIACIGFLAFPMFLAHEMVIPVKHLLASLGLSKNIALLITLLAFISVSGVLIVKCYKLNYSK
ncbi:AMP-binding protein [Marinibactrum halimedae]|nr:AMP-binding protein [Marinibactrum halimedae]MCD9459757.1 AMP-binding protein [Marinibactrum halimedae]